MRNARQDVSFELARVVPGMVVPVDKKARALMSYVPSGPNLRELDDGTGRWSRDGKG